jgi:predicted SprT family Zn-dependent metalloprotease
MKFHQLYSLLFEEFKKSPKHIHLFDVPMFSIYVKEDQKEFFNETLSISHNELKEVFASARNKIIKMGFSAMHANVLFDDLRNRRNQNTGGAMGGYASPNGKFMAIDISQLKNLKYIEKVIVHEWAHLWMFNNSSGFKKAVKEFYNHLFTEVKPHVQTDVSKLPAELEASIFSQLNATWVPTIKNFFNPQRVIYYLNEYIVANNVLTINDAQYLPHGVTIWNGISKKAFSDVSVGDEIYLTKVGNGWIIGSKQNSNKPNRFAREISIPFDQLQSYLDGTREEIEQKFNEIKRPRNPRSNIEMRNHVKQYIKTNIIAALELSLKNIIGYASKSNLKNDTTFIDAAVKIISPNLLRYLRNIVRKPNLGERVYDKFWVTPSDKTGISYTEKMTEMILNNYNEKEKNKIRDLSTLSGEEHNDIRKKIAALVEWVNEYGMSNDDEIWATGVEEFVKLPDKYKKEIIRLMQTQDRRHIPNRTMRKKMKT